MKCTFGIRLHPLFKVIFCYLILGFPLIAAEPTTQQLVAKAIRDGDRFFGFDDDEDLHEILRNDPHRKPAQAMLGKQIEAASGNDLKNALEVHRSIFGEEASLKLFLEAAKREPIPVLSALSDFRSSESEAIRQFVLKSMASDDLKLRNAAVSVPGNHGTDSIPLLIEILQSTEHPASWDHYDLNFFQQKVLTRMEENGSLAFLPPLFKLLDHPPSAPRAVETLMALQDSWDAEAKSQTIKALLTLFKKPSHPARFAAAKALALLENPTGVGFLLDGMEVETKFSVIDRHEAFYALLPLLDKNPIAEDTEPWDIDFPKIAENLRKKLAKRGWSVTDTRTRPSKLTLQDEAIFQALREGNLRLPDLDPTLDQETEQALANPPAYDQKPPSLAPKFARLAAVFFREGDQSGLH